MRRLFSFIRESVKCVVEGYKSARDAPLAPDEYRAGPTGPIFDVLLVIAAARVIYYGYDVANRPWGKEHVRNLYFGWLGGGFTRTDASRVFIAR